MCFLSFFLGILLGVGGFIWFQIGGITPPASQDTTRIEVGIGPLKPEDEWLDKVHFQIVPLSDVRSVHQYFIILMTPPAGGIQAPANANAEIDLTSSTDSTVQPFGINRTDFGVRGDQPVLKFIEGGISLGHNNQKLAISSGQF
jgi:hypothetical protein